MLFIDEKCDEGHDNNTKSREKGNEEVEKWNSVKYKSTSKNSSIFQLNQLEMREDNGSELLVCSIAETRQTCF